MWQFQAAGPLRSGPGGIWAQRGPFSKRNAIGQGRRLVIHMSTSRWLSLILTESLSVEASVMFGNMIVYCITICLSCPCLTHRVHGSLWITMARWSCWLATGLSGLRRMSCRSDWWATSSHPLRHAIRMGCRAVWGEWLRCTRLGYRSQRNFKRHTLLSKIIWSFHIISYHFISYHIIFEFCYVPQPHLWLLR